MAVIVGGVIEQDGKYLLVQEAQAKCRGQWNLPAGHLDPGESVFAAAKREVYEESGLEVELTGICQIGNRILETDTWVSVIFTTKVIGGEIKIDPSEILDVKWFSYEEILEMRAKLRNEILTLGAIDNVRLGIAAPLEMVAMYDPIKSN